MTAEQNDQRARGFRVVYLGTQAVLAQLSADFRRVGIQPEPGLQGQGEAFVLSKALARRLPSFIAGHEMQAPATIFFCSDIFQVAHNIAHLEPDLIILDERVQLPKIPGVHQKTSKRRASDAAQKLAGESSLDNGDQSSSSAEVLHSVQQNEPNNGSNKPPLFEDFRSALTSFSPRGYHYPTRRILVVLPSSEDNQTRSFNLGLANVRGVITDPASSAQLFLFAIRQLYEFRMSQQKKSLCISGGGLEGYIYAIGVTNALDDAMDGSACNQFDIFCGVSSGAILASFLAAGTHSHDILKQLYKRHGKLDPLSLNVIFDLAGGEIVSRIVGVLRMLSTLDPGEVVVRLQRLVPVGFFRGERLKAFIERQLSRLGIPDNISALSKELYISATDQDTGEHVVFGEEPWRNIKISQAIRASTALPPFYLPERVNGHWFADGQLTSSSDFNTAIRKGAGLILMIDPMVAYTSNFPGAVMRHGGYFTAVQAIKSLVQTRFSSMLKHSMDVNPDVDFVVFRPTDEVMEAMAGNPMRYRIRTELAEMGYRGAVQQILAQYDSLVHKFAKHGLVLKPRSTIELLLSKQFS
ncbi:MAG: patatin-like phospholipase family protein [Betaproteobacteria bacterium]|nr:patatin-like phospholipase family protein [Betaproteobacteria bacterium]